MILEDNPVEENVMFQVGYIAAVLLVKVHVVPLAPLVGLASNQGELSWLFHAAPFDVVTCNPRLCPGPVKFSEDGTTVIPGVAVAVAIKTSLLAALSAPWVLYATAVIWLSPGTVCREAVVTFPTSVTVPLFFRRYPATVLPGLGRGLSQARLTV